MVNNKISTHTVFSSKWIYFWIIILSIPVFYFSAFDEGYLKNEAALGQEIWAPADTLSVWGISKAQPFGNRLLFKYVVTETASAISPDSNKGLYNTYVVISYIFFLATVLTFYYLIRINGYGKKLSLLGLVLFMMSPTVLMAYKLPTHLREDFMVYFLVVTGLIALNKKSDFLLLLVFFLGPLCRETFLIFPFSYLFFTNFHSVKKRILYSSIPVSISIAIRLYFGVVDYDMFEGLRWTMSHPGESIAFILITFHLMWVILFAYFAAGKKLRSQSTFFDKSILPVVLLIFLTTFVGGIFKESRLLFLAFPWVIMITLKTISSDRHLELKTWFNKSSVKLFLLFQPILILLFVGAFTQIDITTTFVYKIPYVQWSVLTILYAESMLFVFIHYFPLFKSRLVSLFR